jgi:hypothetical protein
LHQYEQAEPDAGEDHASDNHVDETLHIWVRDPRVVRYSILVPGLPFAALWPAVEDSSWDHEVLESPLAADLRALSEPGRGGRRHIVELLGAVSGEPWWVEGPDTPEDALLALYTTWLDADLARLEAFEAFEEEHLDGLTWETISPEQRTALRSEGLVPAYDPQPLLTLASDVAARWPDHPVADHASLALVEATISARSSAEEVLSVLDAVPPGAHRVQAALLVTEHHGLGLSDELVEWVGSVRAEDPLNQVRLTSWAMTKALANAQWGLAGQLLSSYEADLAAPCAVDDPHHAYECEYRQYAIRDASGRLAAMGIRTPTSWREALTADAWRCHLEVHPHTGTSRTTASFDGTRWHFDDWSNPTATTACLTAVETTEPAPTEPVRIHLTLEGPAQR